MTAAIDRRTALALLAAAGAMPAAARTADDAELARIAAATGGRMGVFALDTGSDRSIGHDADTRYAMASTFKLPLAAAVLDRIAKGKASLDTPVPFGDADLLDYAPAVKAAGVPGTLSLERLMAAAITVSDNSAANLLLQQVGGPPGLTRFARALGDRVTRFDRTEPTLNTNLPGDPRDTTTPRAMVGLLRAILLGPALPLPARDRLTRWLVDCRTGLARIRSVVPPGWTAGDKTGTAARGGVNDVAILWPPGRLPILTAIFVDAADAPPGAAEEAHRAAGRRIVAAFA
ncbi:MAG: class A beta-lactamase [Sphingomonas fennica]